MQKGTTNPLTQEGFLRLPEVLAVFPVCRSSWYAGVKKGIYPAGVKLGKRTTAWRVSDLRKLLENGEDK
ncbi:helix-turn-helix transcriptional regulator [Nitrosomonas eutropha]|uniref:AlpA family transcriptional regulator n=2 Tax=Nitrosomonas eutropha TaxID=916 RepID=A0ABX5M5G5_9PROT|nr:AlpA family phage regulatory protein [Nitrosomonas eutropha]PXV79440.1 AlpA family transcriptional regulator [Nitrosomonas eutropha]SEI48056.1 transcriptional regulator, AlpA family [Nitrosomonas eutropha]